MSAATVAATATLYRGEHRLSDVAQVCGVDFDARTLERHYGATTIGRHLSGAIVIYRPGTPCQWVRCATWSELHRWLSAYGCHLDTEQRGDLFTVHLPREAADLAPLAWRD